MTLRARAWFEDLKGVKVRLVFHQTHTPATADIGKKRWISTSLFATQGTSPAFQNLFDIRGITYKKLNNRH